MNSLAHARTLELLGTLQRWTGDYANAFAVLDGLSRCAEDCRPSTQTWSRSLAPHMGLYRVLSGDLRSAASTVGQQRSIWLSARYDPITQP